MVYSLYPLIIKYCLSKEEKKTNQLPPPWKRAVEGKTAMELWKAKSMGRNYHPPLLQLLSLSPPPPPSLRSTADEVLQAIFSFYYYRIHYQIEWCRLYAPLSEIIILYSSCSVWTYSQSLKKPSWKIGSCSALKKVLKSSSKVQKKPQLSTWQTWKSLALMNSENDQIEEERDRLARKRQELEEETLANV